MARLILNERRTFLFTPPLLLDACLAFDREHHGRLWRADEATVSIGAQGDGRIVLTVSFSAGAGTETAERSAAWVAASLLQYCFSHRIPVPRQAQKRIEVVEGGLQFVIEVATAILTTGTTTTNDVSSPAGASAVSVAAAPETPPEGVDAGADPAAS